ncbi:MAG: THUMP domain-containing protein [Thermoprotei archaeon]
MLIVVTSKPGKETRAFNEIMDLFLSYEITASRSSIFSSSGVFVIDADCDIYTLAKHLKGYKRIYSLKVMPLQLIVNNTLEDLANGVRNLMKDYKGTFAVRAVKRGKISAKTIEDYLGTIIVKELGLSVNLRNPNHIVIVEGLGSKAGLSIFNPELYLLFARKKGLSL